ncbi:replication protein RepA [uncultured Zhongshania sp.]|uniref:replication protein RepA n=1 Tax=uncultured Zhongshania sp. TaxID=1642288 RepID=UPI0025F0C727|nr:replication protein RepA [uncultured Zhongshania sp.]
MSIDIFPDFQSLEVVYVPHWMGQIALPVDKRDETEFQSVNGDYRLFMVSPSKYGLPYGVYPRLLIIYLATMAKITKRLNIQLGTSQTSFLKSLGRSSTGGAKGSIDAIKMQAMRLFSTAMYYEQLNDNGYQWINYALSDEGTFMWTDNEERSWCSEIVLSHRFFLDIVDHSFPINRQTLIQLSSKPTQLDIYCWLTSRAGRVKGQTNISWAQLYNQFGNDIKRQYHFRFSFKRSFTSVLEHYPTVQFSFSDKGITLRPFPPHVPRTK